MAGTIASIMTRDVKTLQQQQVLLDALTLLREHRVRHIPILDGERLVGVLTDRDVKRATPSALVSEQRAVWDKVVRETPLSKVMTRDPTTAAPDTTLARAVRLFVDERIGCLPVLERGRLVGIVTAHDLLRALADVLEGGA